MSADAELFNLAMDYAFTPELTALKQRFANFDGCKDHATAAAFGYLAAKKDAEEKGKEGPDIGDQVIVTIEQAMEGEMDAEYAGELVMALVYKWLYQSLSKDEAVVGEYYITCIKSLFAPHVKPGVIKQ
jgi:hypothetical protein